MIFPPPERFAELLSIIPDGTDFDSGSYSYSFSSHDESAILKLEFGEIEPFFSVELHVGGRCMVRFSSEAVKSAALIQNGGKVVMAVEFCADEMTSQVAVVFRPEIHIHSWALRR